MQRSAALLTFLLIGACGDNLARIADDVADPTDDGEMTDGDGFEPDNEPPVPASVEVARQTTENGSVILDLSAADPEGDALTYEVTTAPAHGTVTSEGPLFTYTPALNYSGEDAFVVTISDAINRIEVTVTIEVGNTIQCGDGVVEGTEEECDDGNALDSDGCRNACTLQVCGDGFVGGTEERDDVNPIDDDACGNDCTLPVCGDGFVGGSEECDDANQIDTDACRNSCTPRSGYAVLSGEKAPDDALARELGAMGLL